MSIRRRLDRLGERIKPPDPAEAEREREYARQMAILEAMDDTIHDYPGPLKDYPEERAEFVERSVRLGLANHGHTADEVEDMLPSYVAMYEELDGT